MTRLILPLTVPCRYARSGIRASPASGTSAGQTATAQRKGSERMGAFIMRPEALMEEKMMQALINSIADTADDLSTPVDCLLLLHSLRNIPVVW